MVCPPNQGPLAESSGWNKLVKDIEQKLNIDTEKASKLAKIAFHEKGDMPSLEEAIGHISSGEKVFVKKTVKQNINQMFNSIRKKSAADRGYAFGVAEGKTIGAIEQGKVMAAEIKKLNEKLDKGEITKQQLKDRVKELGYEVRWKEAEGKLVGEIAGKRVGRKEGIAIEKAAQKEFAERVNDYLKNNEKLRGKLSQTQIDAITRKAAKIGSSERAFANFSNYSDKVIEKENFAKDVSSIQNYQSGIKKNWKKGKFMSKSEEAIKLMNFDPSNISVENAEQMANYMKDLAGKSPSTENITKAVELIPEVVPTPIPEVEVLAEGEVEPEVKVIDYENNDNQYYDSVVDATQFSIDYEGHKEIKEQLKEFTKINYDKAKELLSKANLDKYTYAMSELANGNVTSDLVQVVSEFKKQQFEKETLSPFLDEIIPGAEVKKRGKIGEFQRGILAYISNAKKMEGIFSGTFKDILEKSKTISDSVFELITGLNNDFLYKNVFRDKQLRGLAMDELTHSTNSIILHAEDDLSKAITKKGVLSSVNNFFKLKAFQNSNLESIIKHSLPDGDLSKLSNESKLTIAKQMVGIVMHQIDYMSNSGKIEGKEWKDQLDKDFFKRGFMEGNTFQDFSKRKLTKDDKSDIEGMVAYGILTNFGEKDLSDFTKEELLGKLSEEQKKYMNEMRGQFDSHSGMVTTIMMRNGELSPLLADYIPRFRKETGFDEIGGDDTGDIFNNMIGGDNSLHMSAAQAKSRQSYSGSVDLDPSRVLIKSTMSIGKDYHLLPFVKEKLGSFKEIGAKQTAKTDKENNTRIFTKLIFDREISNLKSKLNVDNSAMKNEVPMIFRAAKAAQKTVVASLLKVYTRQLRDFSANMWNATSTYGFFNTAMDMYNKVSKDNPSFFTSHKESGELIESIVKDIQTTIIGKIANTYDVLGEVTYTREESQKERSMNWQDLKPISGYWSTMFKKSFYEATGKEFDLKEYNSNKDFYLDNHYEALNIAAYKADYNTQKSFSDLQRLGASEKVNLGLGKADRDSLLAHTFGFMLNYQAHQFYRTKRAVSLIGEKGHTSAAIKDIVSVLGSEYIYTTLGIATSKLLYASAYSVVASLFPDDKEKRKEAFEGLADKAFFERQAYKFNLLKDNIAKEFSQDVFPSLKNVTLSLAVNPRILSWAKPLAGNLYGTFVTAKRIAEVGNTENREDAKELADLIKQDFYKYRSDYGISIVPWGSIASGDAVAYDKAIKNNFQNEYGKGFWDNTINSVGSPGAIASEIGNIVSLKDLLQKSINGEAQNPTEIYAATAFKTLGLLMALGKLEGVGPSQSLAGDANKLANKIINENKSIEKTKMYNRKRGVGF